jgi:hypothetical protein
MTRNVKTAAAAAITVSAAALQREDDYDSSDEAAAAGDVQDKPGQMANEVQEEQLADMLPATTIQVCSTQSLARQQRMPQLAATQPTQCMQQCRRARAPCQPPVSSNPDC